MTTPDTPSAAAARIVRTRTGDAAVYDEGAGTPLVAIHGLPGVARDFRWIAPVLSQKLRLIRVDMPAFGGTPLSTAPSPSVASRARFIVDVADALELDRFFVLGHSMGGPIAAQAAALLGDRARGLALISSVGPRPHVFYRRLRWLIAITPTMSGPLVRPWEMILARGFENSGFRGPFNQGACVHTMRCVRALDFAAHRQTVGGLRCETLVSYCEDDPLIEPAVAGELAALAPKGPRLVFKAGAHNPQKSQANELGRAITDWIAPH
ncbi:MAG: alpha/beta hydrolase [Deltaproteobacteria bacterium]|nr:alpha/beta hydrolase [Deltaproteobacteria bacterium]